ncbi:MAG: sigma-70 family RNA polymerase sigma factor [Planctomycetia bacterium]|nr:sigma-70 family RNA polymerase sigma factor [Planctomycetia bacterium]
MASRQSIAGSDLQPNQLSWLEVLADKFSFGRSRLRAQVSRRLVPTIQARVDSSDVLQEAFLEAANRLENRDEPAGAHLDVWLRFLTLQKLAQAHRTHLGVQARDCRRETRLSANHDHSSIISVCALMGDDTSPSQAAVRVETYHRLDEALARLRANDREILRRRFWDGESNAAAAIALGIDESTASKRFVRALRRLKVAFASESFG